MVRSGRGGMMRTILLYASPVGLENSQREEVGLFCFPGLGSKALQNSIVVLIVKRWN